MEPFFHLIIPALFLMAFFPRINKKLILILSPLAILSDFDLFIEGFHRALLHNIFIVIIISLIIYFAVSSLAGKIALFLMSSHLIMDLDYWGSAYFWPIYQKSIYLHAEITREPMTRIFMPIIKFGSAEIIGTPRTSPEIWMSTNALIIIILIILLSIALVFSHKNIYKHKTKSKSNGRTPKKKRVAEKQTAK